MECPACGCILSSKYSQCPRCQGMFIRPQQIAEQSTTTTLCSKCGYAMGAGELACPKCKTLENNANSITKNTDKRESSFQVRQLIAIAILLFLIVSAYRSLNNWV